MPRHCHVTPLLRELHRVPLRQQIHFKILLYTFNTIHGNTPVYLQELTSLKKPDAYRLRSYHGLLLKSQCLRTRVMVMVMVMHLYSAFSIGIYSNALYNTFARLLSGSVHNLFLRIVCGFFNVKQLLRVVRF